MNVLRAMGSGIFLIVLALLMPAVFAELTKTVVIFLQSAQQALTAAGIIASYAGSIPPPH